jgi:hypothetical protein
VTLLLACSVGQAIVPTPTAPLRAPTVLPSAIHIPTRTARSNPPAWWPLDLPMPKTAVYVGDASRTVWTTPDVNVTGLSASFVAEAADAGYKPYIVTQSQGSIYDLFFVKGTQAFGLNLTQGSAATFLTVSRLGIFHLRVSGVTQLEIDLPMQSHLDVTPGSEIAIGTAMPDADCASCQYYVNVHIAPFNGVGAYDSKPGVYIIDVEVIPGGTMDQDDYRWAQSCTVNVKDASSGGYQCIGLQNVNDQTQRIDISGSWEQPP